MLLTLPLATFLVPGLASTDPVSHLAVLIVLLATALAATCGPIVRALAVSPAEALRVD